jgi:hypothetical protein
MKSSPKISTDALTGAVTPEAAAAKINDQANAMVDGKASRIIPPVGVAL